MIPALRHILGTHTFLSRRHGWKTPLDELSVQGCLKEARQLTGRERDEPAALFFVFSKAWARLGDACAVMPDLLARNHARAVGLDLGATPEEWASARCASGSPRASRLSDRLAAARYCEKPSSM